MTLPTGAFVSSPSSILRAVCAALLFAMPAHSAGAPTTPAAAASQLGPGSAFLVLSVGSNTPMQDFANVASGGPMLVASGYYRMKRWRIWCARSGSTFSSI